MLRSLAGIVDVRPREIRRVGGMFALLGLIIATAYILKPVRSSLFLSEFGSEQLPYVYIVVAIVLGVVAAGFGKWVPRANLPRLLAGASYFFALQLLVFWLAIDSGWPFTGFVFYVWVSIFTAVMPSLFWLLANYIFYANEGRRLFPVVMAGGLLGSILGGAITSFLVRFVETKGLLLSAIVLLIGVGLLVRWNTVEQRERMAERRMDLAREEKSGARPDDKPWRLVARSRYLSMIAALIVLTTMTSTLVDYQFNTAVEQSFETTDAMTGFFGTFFAAINIVAFVLQLLVVGRLLSRLGVAAGLAILPLALLSSSIAFLLFPRLLTAALVKTSDDGLSNSVNKSSVEVLYLPISLAVKTRLKSWLDMFVERTSRGLAGVTILMVTGVFSLSVNEISLVVIALLLPWLALVVLSQREYVKTFQDSLSRRDISDVTSQMNDPASLSVFRQALDDADDRELVYVLELLQGVDAPELLERVIALSSHHDANVRRASLRLLRGASTPPELSDFPSRARDPDPGAAAEAMALWVRTNPDEGYRALQTCVREGETGRIDAVLDILDLTEELVTEADIESFVIERCNRDDPADRRLAARAAGFLRGDSPGVLRLPGLLKDPEIDVARAAALSIGRLRHAPGFPLLITALSRRPLRAAARKAIASFGVDRLESLTERLRDEQEDVDIRRALPSTLVELADIDDTRVMVMSVIMNILPHSDRRLHYQAIKALGKLRTRFPEMRFSRSEVDRLQKREAFELGALASLLDGVKSRMPALESHGLLVRVLEERMEFTRERIFRLWGLIHPPNEVFGAWDRIAKGQPAVRATALEYLHNVLSPYDRTSLLPLVEATSSAEVHEISRKLLGTSRLTFTEALTRLLRHRDYWVAASAATLAGELEGAPLKAELASLKEHPSEIVREAVENALSNNSY